MERCSSIVPLVPRGRRLFVLVAAVTASALLAACGGGAPQDAGEKAGNYKVQITTASFPLSQTLAQHSEMVISVRNTGSKAIPDIAVTVCNVTCSYDAKPGEGSSSTAFASNSGESFLNHNQQPVWVVDHPPDPHGCGYSCQSGGPGGAVTAYDNTWALGRLKPGATATFRWRVTAVGSGRHVVAWVVAAGLNGEAKAVLDGGAKPKGTFAVTVSHAPAQSYVDNSGRIVTTG